MKLLPPIPMSDNCVILFWLLLLLTSINLICFAESFTLLKNESDRLALLAFKDAISDDPSGVLSSWNDSLHFCLWDGVTCSRRHPQRVVALNLSYQSLRGSLSPHIGNLSFLRTIALYNNTLEGHIPQEIGCLFRLRSLRLTNNSLDGEIPQNLTRCLQLRFLSLYGNKLVGNIPLDIGSLSKLYWLSLAKNNLIGHIPPSLGNLSSLTDLYLNENSLDGSILEELGRLAKLQNLYLGVNSFNGEIPQNLTRCLQLRVLNLYGNKLVGKIPLDIGSLPKLYWLSLRRNNLTGNIPPPLGNLSLLTSLYLGENSLDGRIPKEIGRLVNLQNLEIHINKLSGMIPLSLYNLSLIRTFDVAFNHLYGSLPPELGLIFPNLEELYIGVNRFTGLIPVSLGNASRLSILDAGSNNFTGSLPMNLGRLKGIVRLAAFGNQLINEKKEEFTFITSLTNCSGLKYLDLHDNQFSGILPNSIANLSTQLTVLWLNGNQFCGAIPRGLENLANLISLNLGENIFTGFLAFQSKKLREKLAFTSSMRKSFLQVTYGELFKATDGFSLANLIGEGSFSYVYKGIIDHMEMIVAIKVLKFQQRRASKSFIAECRALRSIRHRNIVRILTVCSSLDFSGSDFMALVVEYMPNESLDSWLHPSANEDEHHQLKNLSLVQRLNVAIDIACALDYLHNHCEAPIIHRDLKPSNVLLDDDMVAHVSDFGLARILSEDIDYSQSQTNSLAIKGTIGYVAPEYGMGANTSTSGDVYSYGIVLLEMLTGKRPSDEMFANNLSLHQFAKMALPERVMEIIDHRLLAEEIEIIPHSEDYEKIRSMMQESLISLVKIGVSCSHESPKERMEMKDVVIEMHKVRDFYLRR